MTDKSPFASPGSWLLKNKLGIIDVQELQDVERVTTAIRAAEGIPQGDFDLNHLKSAHQQLFKDIYPFAGQLRQTETRKLSNTKTFTHPEKLQTNLDKILTPENRQSFKDLPQDQFTTKIANLTIKLNTEHPFQEGNGRTLRAFAGQLAKESGYSLNFESVDKTQWNTASKLSFDGDQAPMHSLFKQIVSKQELDNEQTPDIQYTPEQLKTLYPQLIGLAEIFNKQIQKNIEENSKEPVAIGVFFDGTANRKENMIGHETNVWKLHEMYDSPEKMYIAGVGTNWNDRVRGGVSGFGSRERIDKAADYIESMEDKYKDRGIQVDIVGFSRGSAQALDLANELQRRGLKTEIRSMSIFDTVASYGNPTNNKNGNYD